MPQWAWVSLAMIILHVLVMGLALELQAGWSSVPEPLRSWLLARTHPRQPRHVLSIIRPTSAYFRARYAGKLRPVSAAKRTPKPAETPHDIRETDGETISFGGSPDQAVAASLARLIHAGKLQLTDAVRIGCGAKSGERYQRWSRLIKAALEQVRAGERAVVLQPDGTTAPLTYPVTAAGR